MFTLYQIGFCSVSKGDILTCQLRVASCQLIFVSCELISVSCELSVDICQLRVDIRQLRVASWKLIIVLLEVPSQARLTD